jgi:alpha-L-fucosidase
MKKNLRLISIMALTPLAAAGGEMDELWGQQVVKLNAEDAEVGQLFDEGNYAMFVHWGLYSMLGGKYKGKTYYGISEWIMHERRAGIPIEEYKALASEFNPVNFDAMSIAQLAKDAGMKYIIITSKHHDGFAMYDSEVSDFNVVDATPWGKDPMKELAKACRELGLGFGFYYSHNQDWVHPGGDKGGRNTATSAFQEYFENKCLPQVEEITTEYGPMVLIWFDTPGAMPKQYVETLIDVVKKNQPNALVSGRAGYGLGDYQTLGDMEIPNKNEPGLWESVDTTNDSWAYAWYDQNWKTPAEILHRLIATVARGGTYMLNIGPRADGSVPERAARSLRKAGEWIKRYPQVVYGVDPSPWGHAMPWGDVTVKNSSLYLSIELWPTTGELYLPGLANRIISARLLDGDRSEPLVWRQGEGGTILKLPCAAPEKWVSVIELNLDGEPDVDPTLAIDPNQGKRLLAEFAEVENAQKSEIRWMEKFGEWLRLVRVNDWRPGGRATWEIDILKGGDYSVSLTYAGKDRLVWGVGIDGGEHIRNEQNSSHNYQEFPIGWINFPAPGRYTVSVSCLEGDLEKASLKAIRFKPVWLAD